MVYIFSQDTARVFADQQGVDTFGKTSYDAHYTGHALRLSTQQNVTSEPNNKPHPTSVTFLRQNPRFICEPICYVKTSLNAPVTCPSWWPEELPEKTTKVPQRSLDSTARSDYRAPPVSHDKSARYSSNLAMQSTSTTTGIVPRGVPKTGSKMTKVKEKISYEHQFNSRLDPSQPIRGRRHGSFIWKVVSDFGKQNKRNSQPVEYAYTETDKSMDTMTTQHTAVKTPDIEETMSLDKSAETCPPFQ